ncbi:hypothetical protein Tco_0071674 [Tanacetum coccineum]
MPTINSLHPSDYTIVPTPLPAPSTSRRADIPEADTPPRKRLLLTTPRPGCEVGESSLLGSANEISPETHLETRPPVYTERRMMTALELVNRRITYQRDDMLMMQEKWGVGETRQALARSSDHCRTLEARVTLLETEVRRHEWQRQAADDLAVQHIMRTQALRRPELQGDDT